MSTSPSGRLSPLIAPGSVAVVGASERTGPGRNIISNLLGMGYPGAIYPVNPRYAELMGLPCYPDLSSLPQPPDCVAIAVPASAAVEIVAECAALGVPAVTVMSSGFAETGAEGAARQARLHQIARQSGMLLCGPNTLGILSYATRSALYSGSLPPGAHPGPVAILSQSGSMAIALLQSFAEIGVSHVIACGNQAGLDLADYLAFLADDPATGAIALFIEGLPDGRAFVQAARRAKANGKPVVALKVGRSELGRHSTITHTGSLAGEDRVYEAAFRRAGVERVLHLDEMTQVLRLLTAVRPIRGPGLAVTAISGGQIGLIADEAEARGLHFPPLDPERAACIDQLTPAFLKPANPLDLGGTGNPHWRDYTDALLQLAAQSNIDLIAVSQDIPQGLGPSGIAHYGLVMTATAQAYQETEKPIILFSNHSTPPVAELREILSRHGVPYLQGTAQTLRAIQAAVRFHTVPLPDDLETTLPHEQSPTRGQRVLSERASKALLAEYGLPVLPEHFVTDAADARTAAEQLDGPVALKVVSAQIPHKTDVGGVCLNLITPDDVAIAYDQMMTTVGGHLPNAHLEGAILAPMAKSGFDLVLGISRDPSFGPVVLFGWGGVYTEALQDTALALAPVGPVEAAALLDGTRFGRVLAGWRGECYDRDGLIRLIVGLSQMAASMPALQQLDLNPVRIYADGSGLHVLDALAVVSKVCEG